MRHVLLTLYLIVVSFSLLMGGCEVNDPPMSGPWQYPKTKKKKKPGAHIKSFVVLSMTEGGLPYRCWVVVRSPVSIEGQRVTWYQNGGTVSVGEPYLIAGTFDDMPGAYKELGITKEVCEELNRQVYNPSTGRYELPPPLPLERPITQVRGPESPPQGELLKLQQTRERISNQRQNR